MSNVKILELDEIPKEGTGKQINLEHPYTEWKYVLAFFNVEGKFYCISDKCKSCEGSLSKGVLKACLLFAVEKNVAGILEKAIANGTTPIPPRSIKFLPTRMVSI